MTSENHILTPFASVLLECADEKGRKGKRSCVFKVLLLEVRAGFGCWYFGAGCGGSRWQVGKNSAALSCDGHTIANRTFLEFKSKL